MWAAEGEDSEGNNLSQHRDTAAVHLEDLIIKHWIYCILFGLEPSGVKYLNVVQTKLRLVLITRRH